MGALSMEIEPEHRPTAVSEAGSTGPAEVEVLIVGAGIAGLTAAIALDRLGVTVEVIERAAALTEAGTALSLWPNALAALDHIGLGDEIGDIGIEEPTGVVSRWSGEEILKLNQSRLNRRLGKATQIVFRADLQSVLLAGAKGIPIRMHTPAISIGADGDMGVVELSTGEQLRAPVVLACDGIRSVARPFVGNRAPKFQHRTSWRAVLTDATELVSDTRLTVGDGQQFIMNPMRNGLVNWAADVSLPEGANAVLTDKKAFLLAAFSGWHPPIIDLIDRTDEDRLVIADFYDAVPRRLVKGPVALLGDAGHPMTPDLGQGACQGIEDAAVVAECLGSDLDRVSALARYESVRLRRVQMIVRESRATGRLATIRSPAASAIRDLGTRHMPEWLNARLVARYAGEDAFRRSLQKVSRSRT
jgi:2-polyprenyl-6-methoxyphenol hydroxylase-like FAD-dependent oxidoreductase